MQIHFYSLIRCLCVDMINAVRAGTEAAVKNAENADNLTIDVPIGGVPLRLEGASNTPAKVFLAKRASIKTQGYLTLDDQNRLMFITKKGLLKNLPEIEIEMEWERSRPNEALEMARDRANEVNKEHVQTHRLERMAYLQSLMEDTDATRPTD